MRFVIKRTLIVSLILCSIALLAGWWGYRLSLRSAIDRLAGEATLLAEHSGRSLVDIDVALDEVVTQIETDWANGRPPAADLPALLHDKAGRLPQVTGLQVVDAGRRVIADHIGGERSGQPIGDRHYFTAFEAGRDPRLMYFGDPVRGQVTGKAFATASFALLTPQGDFGGVVSATFDPFYYRKAYEELELPVRRHDVALVDEQGVILASSSDFAASVELTGDAAGGRAGFQPAASSGGYLRLDLPASGADYIAYLVRVPTFPLYAFVGVKESVALAAWRSLAAGLVLAWLIGTLGSAAAFASIWRREQQREQAFAQLERASRSARDALERAEAASAAKSRFLAHMSHELRTPLNAILGFSEVIRDRMIDSDAARDSEYAGLIHKSGSHLLQIINDLLDLSKIEVGKVPLRRQLLDVHDLLENVGYLTSRDFVDHDVQITTSAPANCPQLYADQRAAKQMLVNLLSNAAKFSHAGGEVQLRAAARPDGGITLTVQDWGRGIPPDKLALLYEPFAAAGGETAEEGQGTGLGLPLVKSLIEQHGGSIAVDSHQGVGTTVTLSFPAPPADVVATASPPPLRAVGGGGS
ncbi:MAG: ATP-binding protein [Kiloniellales bacterium]